MKRRASTWLSLWREHGRRPGRDPDALDAALEAAYQEGAAAHPLELTREAFGAHVARVTKPDDVDALAALSGEGLYIAAACAAQLPGASTRFEAQLFPQLARTLKKMDAGSTFVDEVLQHLRVRLFASPEKSLLLTYSGRGALGAWLKVVAVRDAQRIRRKSAGTGDDAPDDGLARLPSPAADPELMFLKLKHRQDFKAAFAEAMATLDQRQRNVLQMSLVQGLSIDEVGRVYAVHRATAARWVSSAREQLVKETRQRLASRLKLEGNELDSLMGAVRSNLSVSLGALETPS
ncbi:MAG: transcriptional regulator [Myxococcaceae bacterium]|nr:transcriptional regulator [Myxococcaceae bacterium]